MGEAERERCLGREEGGGGEGDMVWERREVREARMWLKVQLVDLLSLLLFRANLVMIFGKRELLLKVLFRT